jgi:prophage regulatory protein
MSRDVQTETGRVVLALPQVMARVSLRRSAIYRAVRQKSFPAPVRLGARRVGWILAEIDRWVDTKIAARDEA